MFISVLSISAELCSSTINNNNNRCIIPYIYKPSYFRRFLLKLAGIFRIALSNRERVKTTSFYRTLKIGQRNRAIPLARFISSVHYAASSVEQRVSMNYINR